MSLDRTPLDVGSLSPAARKALGPGPGRMMASRGMVPLPPGEQIAVLYQLTIDPDANLSAAARATALGLPDKMLGGALADPSVDARVLDLFAELVGTKAVAFDAIVGNAAVADATIARLAGLGGSREIDRIATNEQRLLRHPEIIAAMYTNKLARMSTVDRAVELAVRNQVRVPGLHAWDEIARALQGPVPPPSPETDTLFAMAAEVIELDDRVLTQGDADEIATREEHEVPLDVPDETKKIQIDKLSIPAKIRLATLGNAFHRAALVRDPVKIVSLAAIKSPGVTEFEAANYARNQTLGDDVIRYIANRREWTKLYGIKFALCRNPKTPIPEAMRLMPFLRDKDIERLIKSKGIPSAVVAQARKLMMQRRGGGAKK
jgi:hypothetical protein